MDDEQREPVEEIEERARHGLSRRELLKRGAVGAVAAGAYPLVAGSAAGAGRRGAALSAADIATIKKWMGPLDSKYSGKGETWKIGSILPFSSTGSVYGIVQGNGVKLGVKHVEALGGPRIKVDFRDHAGGDQVKGKNAVIAYEGQGIGAIISSYGGVVGAIIPEVGRKHILTLDPGGGNAHPFDKKPYFYGFRADPFLAGIPLAGAYLSQKLKVKRVVIPSYDIPILAVEFVAKTKVMLKKYGIEVVDVIKAPINATDYSNTITAVRAAGDYDAVMLFFDGLSGGFFIKQYKSAGLNKPLVFWEGVLGPTVKVTGSAYEGVYSGGVDDFSTATKNPWGRVLVKDYWATFGNSGLPGEVPDYYSAGYYMAVFALWRLYRDVKKKGGDVNNGAHLKAALEANPRFPSVFGGDASSVGVDEFDLVTHGLKHRPTAFYQVRNGAPVKLASSDVYGHGGVKLLV